MNVFLKLALIASIALAPLFGCSDDNSFIDKRDGKTYRAVKIGKKVWMAENLNYAAEGSKCYGEDGLVYNSEDEEDGCDFISIEPSELFGEPSEGDTLRMVRLSNNEIQANCEKYGRLYDWETAMKVCPQGWHLPSKREFAELYLYTDATADTAHSYHDADNVCKYLKAKHSWEKNGNGDDKFGFAILPSGMGSDFFGINHYQDVGKEANLWTSTEHMRSESYTHSWLMYCDCCSDNGGWGTLEKSFLFGVRCVRD